MPRAGAPRDDLVPVSAGRGSSTREGQYGLLREFIPGEPVSTTAYRRRLPALYVSAGVPDRLEPAWRPPRALHRLHGRIFAAGGHVRHPLRHRGPRDLRAGAGRGWARRRQERAARVAHLRGRTPRHPLGRTRPVRATRPADRAAGAARAQRAPRPDRSGQRNAEPVRRRGLAGAQRLPDTTTPSPRPRCWLPRTASCSRWTSSRCCCRRRSSALPQTSLVISDAVRATGGDRDLVAVGRRGEPRAGWTSPTATWWPTTCATWRSCRCPGCSSPRRSPAPPG